MYLNQMTDAQLIERINGLGQDILASTAEDHLFDGLCSQYDAVVDELQSRGLWE
jgi:hypothetical protein